MTVPGHHSSGVVNYSFWGNIYNASASFREPYPPGWSTQGRGITHGIFLLVFTVIGSTFNAFMIIAIVPNRRLRTVRNILLVHLGAVGLASSLLTTLYAGVVSLCGYWLGGQGMCYAYGFLQSVFTLTSVWTIAALSWDKYQTIASPLHHSLTATARKMTSLFSVFWFCALVISLPPLFGGSSYVFSPVTGTCFIDHLDLLNRWYVGILVSAMFYIPLIVMIYCYTHIFRIARTQSSRIAATMVRMACVVQAPIALTTQTAPLSTSIKGTKAMLTILQLVGAFTLTYIPFSIVILVETATGSRQVDPMLVSIVTTLFQAAPMTNSAIYGIRNKILRNSFIRYTRRKVQLFCYKDKRKGSVKRSSSFRMSLMQRKANHQNGGVPSGHLRRTQSLQVRHLSVPRSDIVKFESSENIRKTRSFTLQNGHAFAPNEDEECCLAPPPSLNNIEDITKSEMLIMKKVSDSEKEKMMDDNDNEEAVFVDEEGDEDDHDVTFDNGSM
ncbi:short-wave-sensitive opsin 1-like [Argopecten irradians]|uniref:short-wave-sensitive opsin 1-like n=1 Tax=Argopecten irradians TaxID=31199 RepID=UPI00371088E9